MSRLIILAIVIFGVVSGQLRTATTPPPPPAPVTATVTTSLKGGLLIPLYQWPTTDEETGTTCVAPDYIKIANSPIASRTIVIIGPEHGPHTNKEGKGEFLVCIKMLREKGVKAIGYVHSKHGWPAGYNAYRKIEEVILDINAYDNEYDIDGIFVDETTALWPDAAFDSASQAITYYGNLLQAIKTANSAWMTVYNPGIAYLKDLTQDQGDLVKCTMFESSYAVWSTSSFGYPAGPWAMYEKEDEDVADLKALIAAGQKIRPSQSSVMIYGVPDAAAATAVVKAGLANNIQWFYVTQNPQDTAYSELPSPAVWDAVVKALG